jgi:hypothetical protein
MTNTSARVAVHPSTLRGYVAERLRKAAQIEDITERQKFLEAALEKYRVWATGLGAPLHKISADVAILRCQFFPPRQRLQA